MRELKFRAWSGTSYTYFGGDYKEPISIWTRSGTALLGNSHVVSFYTDEDRSGGCYTDLDIEEVDSIEQYTGLKDKNGKEIYEGDIVKARWRRAKNARLDAEGEIKFDCGWFYIDDDPDGQDRLGIPIHNCYTIEVIGNIHENPELLEKEE